MPAGWEKRAAEVSTNTRWTLVLHNENLNRVAGLDPSANTRDRGIYALGAGLGVCAGFLDVKFGDLLLTALFVLAATMLLGALRPRRPWRWTLLGGRVRPAGSIDCLRRADRKTLSRPDLRIVSRLPDRNCRSLRWSDSEKRIAGIVEVKSAALGRQLSAFYALVSLSAACSSRKREEQQVEGFR